MLLRQIFPNIFIYMFIWIFKHASPCCFCVCTNWRFYFFSFKYQNSHLWTIHFKSTRNVITDKNTGKMWILVIGCNIFKCNNLLVRRCLHCWLISNGKTAISHKCIDKIMLIFLITWHCLLSTNITCLTRVYLHAVLFNPWEQSACSILLDFFDQQQNGTISMMLWNDVSVIPLKRNNFIPISDAWCMILS